jgi:Trk-type K+ transport system membrane component
MTPFKITALVLISLFILCSVGYVFLVAIHARIEAKRNKEFLKETKARSLKFLKGGRSKK